MARAVWRNATIAESEETQVVDGYTYFPAGRVDPRHLRPSEHSSVCGWKGTASYHDVVVGDDVNRNAAWTYLDPKPEARHLAGWIGFWRGIQIVR